jgi:hypothetical protein
MITDKTLDEALVEAHRFIKAAKALRAKRKAAESVRIEWAITDTVVEHAACKRASLDLTRKLADLRQGR